MGEMRIEWVELPINNDLEVTRGPVRERGKVGTGAAPVDRRQRGTVFS